MQHLLGNDRHNPFPDAKIEGFDELSWRFQVKPENGFRRNLSVAPTKEFA